VGIKAPFSKSNANISPDKLAGPAREAKIAEANDDWSEKTASSWSEHSGFLEISKVSNVAPPPRMDPRTVPRPVAPSASGLSPRAQNILLAFVLVFGSIIGLYANGFFDRPKQRAPAAAAPAAQPPTANH